MCVQHFHERIGIELFDVEHAGTRPFSGQQHRRADHRGHTGSVTNRLIASFGEGVFMIANIVDVERFFLAILAYAGRDIADIGFAFGRCP